MIDIGERTVQHAVMDRLGLSLRGLAAHLLATDVDWPDGGDVPKQPPVERTISLDAALRDEIPEILFPNDEPDYLVKESAIVDKRNVEADFGAVCQAVRVLRTSGRPDEPALRRGEAMLPPLIATVRKFEGAAREQLNEEDPDVRWLTKIRASNKARDEIRVFNYLSYLYLNSTRRVLEALLTTVCEINTVLSRRGEDLSRS
jgi:hypothetical protein